MIIWRKNTFTIWIFEVKEKVVFPLDGNLNMLCLQIYMQTQIPIMWKILHLFVPISGCHNWGCYLLLNSPIYIYSLGSTATHWKVLWKPGISRVPHGKQPLFSQQSLSFAGLFLGWASQALCRVAFFLLLFLLLQESRAPACVWPHRFFSGY